jgi:hypothetical protein
LDGCGATACGRFLLDHTFRLKTRSRLVCARAGRHRNCHLPFTDFTHDRNRLLCRPNRSTGLIHKLQLINPQNQFLGTLRCKDLTSHSYQLIQVLHRRAGAFEQIHRTRRAGLELQAAVRHLGHAADKFTGRLLRSGNRRACNSNKSKKHIWFHNSPFKRSFDASGGVCKCSYHPDSEFRK